MKPPLDRRHARAAAARLLTGGLPRPTHHELVKRRHRVAFSWGRLARQIAGWIVIAWGLVAIVLPLQPAVVFIPIGVALVGRRQWLVRWSRTRMKLLLRRAETWSGWLGALGRRAAAAERKVAKLLRERRMRQVADTPR